MTETVSTLRETLQRSPRLDQRTLWGADASVRLVDIAHGTALAGALPRLAGRSVLLRVRDPLYAALALIELDGVARRIVLCPPDLGDTALPHVAATAGIDAVVFDAGAPAEPCGADFVRIALPIQPLAEPPPAPALVTEWVMFTSGTPDRQRW